MRSWGGLVVSVLVSCALNVQGRSSHGLSSGTGVPFGSLIRVIWIGDCLCHEAPDVSWVNGLDRISLVEEVMVLQEDEVDVKDILAHIHNFSPSILFYSPGRHAPKDMLRVVQECRARGVHTVSVLFDFHRTVQNLTSDWPPLHFDQLLVDFWDAEVEESLRLGSSPEWFGRYVSSTLCANMLHNEEHLVHTEYSYDILVYFPYFEEESCRSQRQSRTLVCALYSFLKSKSQIRFRLQGDWLIEEELKSLYLQSKIVIIILESNTESQDDTPRCRGGGMYQVYKALAMGAFVMCNEVEGLDLDLVNGSEVIKFKSDSLLSLEGLVDHYLQDEGARLQIVQNAHASVCEHLSLESKMADVLIRASQSTESLHVCKGPSRKKVLETSLIGNNINLSSLVDHQDFINRSGLLIAKVEFQESERVFDSTLCLQEDCSLLDERIPGAMLPQELSLQGMFLVCLHNYMVVADGVSCNGVEPPITAFGRHQWYPPVPHGCDWSESAVTDVPVVPVERALLLVRRFGWFWAHFIQDLVYKLAFTVHALPAGTEFDVIMESNSQPNILPLIRSLLGEDLDFSERLYFMDSNCLRGNGRECSHYFMVKELLISDTYPSFPEIGVTIPHALRLVQKDFSLLLRRLFHTIESPMWHRNQHRDLCRAFDSLRLPSTGDATCELCYQDDSYAEAHSSSRRMHSGWPSIVLFVRGTLESCRKRSRCMLNSKELAQSLQWAAQVLARKMPSSTGRIEVIQSEQRSHSLLQVAAAVSQASIIVTPHGTHVYSAVFARRGTTMIEVCPALVGKGEGTIMSSHLTVKALGLKSWIVPVDGASYILENSLKEFVAPVDKVLRIVFHELDVPVQELVKIEHQRTAGEIRWKILYLNLLHGELCEGQPCLHFRISYDHTVLEHTSIPTDVGCLIQGTTRTDEQLAPVLDLALFFSSSAGELERLETAPARLISPGSSGR